MWVWAKPSLMIARVISAMVGVPLVMGAVWAGLPWLSLLAAAAAVLGVLEFYRMVERGDARPAVLLGGTWALLLIFSGHQGGWLTPWVLLGGAGATLSWHQLSRLVGVPLLAKSAVERRDLKGSLVDWGYTAAGACYIGWALSLALVLRQEARGLEWVLVALLGTFATDTGAFFTGRAWGKRPLAPTVSPGKTWEGAIGGFVMGVGITVALASWWEMPLSLWERIALGVLIGVFSQVGDLVESKLKRASGVKDAGKLIPGHGGILDRLDSVVFALVVVYYFYVWTVR
ncbi:MAG: phosphatidate cytidylyltransferase [Dehalococcoidia bacterium]|nr:phosphatidate cytidylyltransferase [Dehalococcoidia bacterium]